jgi:hypothetical protein
MAIRTVFSMAEECALGEREGWSDFIRDYAPIARRLLLHYFPSLQPEIEQHVTGVFQRARASNNGWFATLRFTNEREFLMSFRELVFAYGREEVHLPTPPVSLEQLREVMKELSVVERELLWLFIKGYTADQIANMMMNAAATAQAVKNTADQKLAQILPGANADSFRLSARVLIEEAERTKSDKCLSLKTFNNLINGQLSWRERELAEEHIRECLNCIDRFTGFNEMIRLRKDAQPLPEGEVEPILEALALAKTKGLFSRLLARRA